MPNKQNPNTIRFEFLTCFLGDFNVSACVFAGDWFWVHGKDNGFDI